MGVLLFQDLAVVPCLILLPALARPAGEMINALLVAMAEAAVVLGALIWAGQRLLRRVYDAVAARRSRNCSCWRHSGSWLVWPMLPVPPGCHWRWAPSSAAC
jgi:Kef-type K+ transport system membrane component KefB